jgi:hypothetical protein
VYDELAILRAENDRLKRELNAVPSEPAIP